MKINPVKNTLPLLYSLSPSNTANEVNEPSAANGIFPAFNEHSSSQRIDTSIVITAALREKYSDYHLIVNNALICPLISFANAGFASYVQRGQEDESIFIRQFIPPARRYGDDSGAFASKIVFAAFDYEFQGHDYLIYIVEGRDGSSSYPQVLYNYILSKKAAVDDLNEATNRVDTLIEKATGWALELHNEVLIFDQGFWQKDAELWKSIQKASWEDVIRKLK